jgi:hypothetical protein
LLLYLELCADVISSRLEVSRQRLLELRQDASQLRPVRKALAGEFLDETQVLYVSPLMVKISSGPDADADIVPRSASGLPC